MVLAESMLISLRCAWINLCWIFSCCLVYHVILYFYFLQNVYNNNHCYITKRPVSNISDVHVKYCSTDCCLHKKYVVKCFNSSYFFNGSLFWYMSYSYCIFSPSLPYRSAIIFSFSNTIECHLSNYEVRTAFIFQYFLDLDFLVMLCRSLPWFVSLETTFTWSMT